MAGLHQVAGLGVGGHGGLHGARAVGGGNAGGDALGGFNRGGEGGGILGAVALDHRWQVQQFAAFARQRQADQTSAKFGHEVDGFGRDVVGGEDEVAFVFAVFFIDQDDHAASAHVGNNIFNGGNQGGHQSVAGWVELSCSMRST